MSHSQRSGPTRVSAPGADPRPERRKGDRRRSVVRIAAVGDFHSAEESLGAYSYDTILDRLKEELNLLIAERSIC